MHHVIDGFKKPEDAKIKTKLAGQT